MPRQLKKILLLITFSIFASVTNAQTPTAQQIEQFKRLPAAQQQQLARQLGVDLSSLQNHSNSSFSTDSDNFNYYNDDPQQEVLGYQNRQQSNQAVEDEQLKLFGANLFDDGVGQISANQNLPVPPSYLISAGDEIRLRIYGKENEDYTLVVDRDGTVTVPKLGPFEVASMSLAEVKSFLSEQIEKQLIGAKVNVAIGQLRSMRILVMGAAKRPGAYNVSSLATITHALSVSGGVTDVASLRNIQVKRSGNLVVSFDLYDLLNFGNSVNDIQLQSGDVVFIPVLRQSVTVDGEVRRPAIYELKNEKSLHEIVELAGGTLPTAYSEAISVRQFLKGSQVQKTISISARDVTINNGDIVTVPSVSPVVDNSVSLIGAVARPGKYQWFQGMKVSDLIGETRKDLLEFADQTYVLVIREKGRDGSIEILQTNLTEDAFQTSQINFELKLNDKVLVFSKIESEVLGDFSIDDLAFSVEDLTEQQKAIWQDIIEDKLFWQKIGLNADDVSSLDIDSDAEISREALITLTEEERDRINYFKDATFYSRKRMLAPVVEKLKEQAKLGAPLQLVEVAGEVKVPGVYPLPLNAHVKDLLIAASGLTEAAYNLKSEITRTLFNENGGAKIEHINFSPFEVMQDSSANNIALKSKDRINIFSLPSWQTELKISVKGEVEFPGDYTISRGEKLSDLLERVGGLTEYADPNAVIFTREKLRQQERENIKRLAEDLRKQIASESLRKKGGAGNIVSYDEAKKLLRDLVRADAVGRLVIDMNAIIAGNELFDVTLEDGDLLFIPGRSQSVNVIGEVYVPTSHLYASELSYEDYIQKSGGYRDLANIDNTYIIRADGSVDVVSNESGFWFTDSESVSQVMPGDTIVVPYDSESVDGLTLWTNATQIIYQLAVAVAAIGSL